MSILIFLIGSYILLSISLYLLFPKANVAGWKGLVPGLNFVEWCKIIGRSPWHALWLLFPIVNIFIYCGMAVDMVRSFEKYGFRHSAIAVIYAPAMFTYLALNKNESYKGPNFTIESEYKAQIQQATKDNNQRQLKRLQANNPYHKSVVREWTEAIVFAVFAAAFIRMFLIEAYKIPTPSMESTLLVGDYLFVSKAHYGIRTPMTPIMVPLLHNRIPFLNTESYLEEPDLPYYRLPALEKINRNEPFVFNWPVGDSVYLTPMRSWTVGQAKRNPDVARAIGKAELVTRPIDKKDHYIKRCVAIAGDSLEIRDRQVYLNGEKAEHPEHLQFGYRILSPTPLNRNKFEEFGIDVLSHPAGDPNAFFLSNKQVEQVRTLGEDVQVLPVPYFNQPNSDLFPHDQKHFPGWTNDNYGPIYIPKKGETVKLGPENIALYWRVIKVYEGNDYRFDGETIFINGEPATEYTFKQDYYWAMGDNRHNSEDSRVWGFVPMDHVVGKPLFIWFSSREGNIRWNRIFKSASR